MSTTECDTNLKTNPIRAVVFVQQDVFDKLVERLNPCLWMRPYRNELIYNSDTGMTPALEACRGIIGKETLAALIVWAWGKESPKVQFFATQKA